MSTNGAQIGIVVTITVAHPVATRKVLLPALTVLVVVAAGTTVPGTAGYRIASTAAQTFALSIWAYAWPPPECESRFGWIARCKASYDASK